MKQKPACILDIRVPAGTFDVNLTPDKREIVLAHGQFRFHGSNILENAGLFDVTLTLKCIRISPCTAL